ncbi:alpha-galactosidase [Paenibacillus sp. Marseille-Q4541]|uniref:alpha-galactosidase n=1 Tax=Paenibacillus sp. Marseille-Q4541 TaxID=2831522 RepID=UPI001BA96C9E|nr:alpha-galactosidase [Paenibacillus sp. Marseille-Q4541]
MSIIYDSELRLFHLQAKDTSYCLQIVREGYLCHLYWGKSIHHFRNSVPLGYIDRGFSPNPDPEDRTFSLDTIPLEYPGYGNGDFGPPAYQISQTDGSTVSDLRYKSHRIYAGKKKLDGLPATYVEQEHEAETLEIELFDTVTGLSVTLLYTVFEEFAAITRSVKFHNSGKDNIRLLRALSASVDFRDVNYDLLTLDGAHTNESNLCRRKLHPGTQSVESRRGASSPQHNPFIALMSPEATEDHGEVYGFNFVYSGNFLANVEVEQYGTTRVSMGLNPFDFAWHLEPSETFQTPEVVMVYSSEGLGAMSRTYHSLYRTRLVRGKFRDQERPILINNWEATYFDFHADKIEQIAKSGKELGMELFVLDDGWFGKRDNDKSSLGDWVVDQHKLPEGLEKVVHRITSMGMQFGIWFEPEMVSPDSDLYRAHPDWVLHVKDRPRTTGRYQLVLDLSRKEVCDYIISSISSILSSASISYLKWDMNRHMTEIGSASLPPERQRETAHRYMLGLYYVMEQLTTLFPDVLFESCSSGGGRFDPGMLYYMPQVWTSDNTDAVSRLGIQYGTSMAYPPVAMGSHVSSVPNHQVKRVTPLSTRGHVAMSGNLGYELDLTLLTDEEKEMVREQVSTYKKIRKTIQFGTFYRNLNPFMTNEASWTFVSTDGKQAVTGYFRILSKPAAPVRILKFKGLDPAATYRIEETGEIHGGDELMYAGLTLPRMKGDFLSLLFTLNKVD